MTIQHRDAPASNMHEPKGIISATTADAGKVLTPSASSNSQSVLRKLSINELADAPTSQNKYVSATVTDNSTSINVPTASDSTLKTLADYVTMLTLFSEEFSNGVDFDGTTNDKFTIETDGLYHIIVNISSRIQNISGGGGDTELAVSLAVNGIREDRRYKHAVSSTQAPLVMELSEYLSLSAGDTVDVLVAAIDNCSFIPEDASIQLELIREL